jgi:hypothetical protein
VLLTVFAKRQRRETGEVARAMDALNRCIAEQHSLADGAED